MNKKVLTVSLLAALLATPFTAHAHRSWILPASTAHSSEDPWVTFDAAVSNDIFHTDYHAMNLDSMRAIGPDGQPVPLQNAHTGKYRSTFDLNLTQRGTYKVYTANAGLSASWQTEDGQRKSYPGRGRQFTPEGFAAEVPTSARNLKVTQSSSRQETFVTAGVPDTAVFAPTNVGLEFVPITHPNDLFAGEAAQFRFLIDGEPAVGAEVTVLAGGMRYRNAQQEILVQTDKDGIAEIEWPVAGMYWMEVSYNDENATSPATTRRGGYIATFEVLPE